MRKLLICFGLFAFLACAQMQPEARSQTFEVAVVNATNAKFPPPGIPIGRQPGGLRFEYRAASLRTLLCYAYNTNPYQLRLPPQADWILKDNWAVSAKAAVPSSKGEMKAMLQSLLADKFKLNVEKAQESTTFLQLSLEPGGLKISPDAPAANGEQLYALTSDGWADDKRALVVTSSTFEDMAHDFWPLFLMPVVDNTNVKGRYSFTIPWGMDPDERINALVEAFRRQLGVKAEIVVGPLNTIRITHAEKPVDN